MSAYNCADVAPLTFSMNTSPDADLTRKKHVRGGHKSSATKAI